MGFFMVGLAKMITVGFLDRCGRAFEEGAAAK